MSVGRFLNEKNVSSKEFNIPESEWRLEEWGDNYMGDVGPLGYQPKQLNGLKYNNLYRPQMFVVPSSVDDKKLRCIIERFAPNNVDAFIKGQEVYFASALSIGGPIHEISKHSLEYRAISVQYIKKISE